MTLKTDLESEVDKLVRTAWTTRSGTVVPDDTSVTLGNDAVEIEATVLYADLADSTNMVNSHSEQFSAEVYKSFLHCCAKIIRAEGGEITAYDGDRIMAVYIGGSKNTAAVRTSMKIAWVARNIIQAKINAFYSSQNFILSHVCGIDTSKLFVAKTGVRGANDLVWVGRAANYAAKLSAYPSNYSKYITGDVFDNSHESVKYTNGKNMWELAESLKGTRIYRSSWWWLVD